MNLSRPAIAFALAWPLHACCAPIANDAVPLGPGPHLFMDDYLIAESIGLTRRVHQPVKLPDPVLPKAEPWHEQPLMYLKVLFDQQTQRFRMWYNVKNPGGGGPMVCHAYAESDDGIRWERPNLGLVDVNGSTANNLFRIANFGTPMSVDEGPTFADPSRRYKTMLWVGNGLGVSFSSDGLHWTDHEGNPVLPYYDYDSPEAATAAHDISDAIWDPLRNRYITIYDIVSVPEDGYKGRTYNMAEGRRRLVAESTSEDFIHWTPVRRVIVPDPQEQGVWEFYGMRPFVRGDLYIGLLRVLRDDLSPDEGGKDTGIGWTELATSRDGENWTWHRDPFLPRNPQPGWDHAMAWAGDCIQVGDEEFIYWCGYSAGHKVGDRQVGLARLRANGFVSRDAGGRRGFLHTPLVTLTGSGMTVNADVEGELRVRILAPDGDPLPGFDWNDCAPIRGDSVRHTVQWKGDFTELKGRPIRLEFALRKAKLYAFEVVP